MGALERRAWPKAAAPESLALVAAAERPATKTKLGRQGRLQALAVAARLRAPVGRSQPCVETEPKTRARSATLVRRTASPRTASDSARTPAKTRRSAEMRR